MLLSSADPSAPRVLVSEPDTQFNAPRWSPDGRRIAVERHRLDERPEVVVVDAETGRVQVVVTADPSMRAVTPAWRPDGRALVVAAARGADVFNLYEVPLEKGGAWRQISFTAGATWPDVSPDGQTIAFSGYTPDGFDVFTLPYPNPSSATSLPTLPALLLAEPAENSRGASEPGTPSTPPTGASRVYSPWRTLAPTFWSPILVADGDQVRLGASTSGVDVLGYHAYGFAASWLTSSSAWSGRQDLIDRGTPDWSVGYSYARWQPNFVVNASRETSFFDVAPSATSPSLTIGVVERRLEAGILLPIQRVLVTQTGLVSMVYAVDEYTAARTVNRSGLRAGWAYDSETRYGFSISPEDGVNIGVTTELIRKQLGATGDATTTVLDGRLYLPGLARHHVVAIRAGAGRSAGDASAARLFRLGGPGPEGGTLHFGSDALTLLRGFAEDSFAGSRIGLINADYRWPLARPQRGWGTFPLFLHTVHAAAGADLGHAWTGQFRSTDVKASVAAELSFDLVAGYRYPLTVTVGGALGRDGATMSTGQAAYIRIGAAF
jgi:hypothetical protein